MKSILLVVAMFAAPSAFAIDSASKVIKSVQCQAEKVTELSAPIASESTIATILLQASRTSPDMPLIMDYSEEFWAMTGNGPQHRTIEARNLDCTTSYYRTKASSHIGRAHYELACSGNSFVRLDLDSKASNGVFVGVTGQTGQFALECVYEKF